MIYLLTHSCHPEHSEGYVYINYRYTDFSGEPSTTRLHFVQNDTTL